MNQCVANSHYAYTLSTEFTSAPDSINNSTTLASLVALVKCRGVLPTYNKKGL